MTLDQLIGMATILQSAGYGHCEVTVELEYADDHRDSYASIHTRVKGMHMADRIVHIEAEHHQE